MGRRPLLGVPTIGLLLLAAACVPVTQPPPPPPPPPPAPTVSCQSVDSLEADLEPASPTDISYDVVAEDTTGAPEVVNVEASDETELAEKVAEVEAAVGPVMAVEESVEMVAQAVTPSNDPRYGTTREQKAALDQAAFAAAWAANEDGANVVVAVVDSGVQGDHPDLYSNLRNGADFLTTGTSPCSDAFGHGTHVAGIIAQADNSQGGIGGAPRVKILPVRVLNSNGSGSSGTVANGIRWAADNGARVINLSLGGPHSSAIESAINYAVNTKDVVVVAAAGNGGAGSTTYPAAQANVIAVGALTTGQTSRGASSSDNAYVDITAPGTQIDSTVPTNAYGRKSGTSMAAAFVSAVAALIRRDCGLSPAGVLAKIQSSATQPVSGFVEAEMLVNAAGAAAGC